MGCLDGLLRWKSIYPGKMLYQDYGIYGKGVATKLKISLSKKNLSSIISQYFKFCFIFSYRRDLLFFPSESSSEFLLWIIFGLTQTEKMLLSCEERLFHCILFILSKVQLFICYHSPLLNPKVNWTETLFLFWGTNISLKCVK